MKYFPWFKRIFRPLCKHDWEKYGRIITLRGECYVYQCTKCGKWTELPATD